MEKLSPLAEAQAHQFASRWEHLHHGYFADHGVLKFYVDTVESLLPECKPDVIVDLTGTRGQVLEEISARHSSADFRLIKIGLADSITPAGLHPRIEVLQQPILDLNREQLCPHGQHMMLLMRSLLHFFGEENQCFFLRHIRTLMDKGEYFIHQSACFRRSKEADCLNTIYSHMERTDKWFPTFDQMELNLTRSGFRTITHLPAVPLSLTSFDLAERYKIDQDKMIAIRDDLMHHYGNLPATFTLVPRGFRAWMHYSLFLCQAT
jgi:hypothetical protein